MKSLIFKETSENIYSLQVDKIKNIELKSLLLGFKVSEITVQYNLMKSISNLKKQNIAYLYDSTIILSFNKSTDDKMISENLIYFFSNRKPQHIPQNLKNFKEKQINDSIWFQKVISDIIVVY